jgi:hypothetical protein
MCLKKVKELLAEKLRGGLDDEREKFCRNKLHVGEIFRHVDKTYGRFLLLNVDYTSSHQVGMI